MADARRVGARGETRLLELLNRTGHDNPASLSSDLPLDQGLELVNQSFANRLYAWEKRSLLP